MNRISLFVLIFLSILFSAVGVIAGSEDQDDGIIHIYRKSALPQEEKIKNLIVLSNLTDVDHLTIEQKQKKFTLIRNGKDPIVFDKINQPSLPWHLPQDQLIQFLSANSFFLRYLSDETYRIDMNVFGLGGGKGGSKLFSASAKVPKRVLTGTKKSHKGRAGKQQRLKALGQDDKASSADRGWIQQDQNAIARGNRKTIRVPPGKELAHRRGYEAHKGYDYSHSELQEQGLHRLQHKYDRFARKTRVNPNLK